MMSRLHKKQKNHPHNLGDVRDARERHASGRLTDDRPIEAQDHLAGLVRDGGSEKSPLVIMDSQRDGLRGDCWACSVPIDRVAGIFMGLQAGRMCGADFADDDAFRTAYGDN